MADAADLKSAGAILVGSSPAPGTINDYALANNTVGLLAGLYTSRLYCRPSD